MGTATNPGRVEHATAIQYGDACRSLDSLQVADIGDVPVSPFDLRQSVETIQTFYADVIEHGCIPLTLGGDHTLTLGVLITMKERYGPVGLIHVDAHADINDRMFGEEIAHGTTFRRAVDEGLLDRNRAVQIGLRGTGYSAEDFDWSRQQGFRVAPAEECWHSSLTLLMEEVVAKVGDGPVYISFDIDSMDPGYAPGTGTVEVAGLTPPQALEIIRGARRLDIVGADLVEVSPPYDHSGDTALLGANLLFEMLCVLPGVKYSD